MEGYHTSVLLKEAIDALEVYQGSWYLDLTLGDGGHTLEILKRGGEVIGVDADPEAVVRAKERLGNSGFLGKVKLVQGNFRDIENLINLQTDTAGQKFKGAIFDLGVSSLQLETPRRGFSFGKEGPIDMRMDPTLAVTALDLINNLSRKELYGLFKNLGEEKYSKRLADALVRAREVKPFNTTVELAGEIVRVLGGFRGERQKIHPATRVFQALRMVVNDELGALEEGLNKVISFTYGNIVVISFHSLEDRIVKNTFKKWESEGLGEVLTKKPAVPSEEEIAVNPRSRSAKMRVFKVL